MSYTPYSMPPPLAVDPTDVAGKRILAWVIDGIIFLFLSNLISVIAGINPKSTQYQPVDLGSKTPSEFCNAWQQVHSGLCIPSNENAVTFTHWLPAVWLFLGLVVVFIVVQGLLGASLGKLALGLRIVREDGSKAGIGPSAIRTVLWIIDAVTCAAPILGGILILTTKGHRRVGDMAAGTYVVPQAFVGKPILLPGQPGFGAYPPMGAPTTMTPGQPVAAQPWAPTGDGPWIRPHDSNDPHGTQTTPPTPSSSGFESDVPIWDNDRAAYIQYDSAQAAWLEFDDATKAWKPISQ